MFVSAELTGRNLPKGARAYPVSQLTQLDIPTYEGSKQTVHPSVVYIPNGFGGYKYWMAHTPYPLANDDYENPSIVASNDGATWVTPAGLTNPIDQPSGAIISAGGHMSDVELLYDGTQLILYYRSQATSSAKGDLLRRTSADGVTWSAATTCVVDKDPVSPAIVRINSTTWEMWLGGSNDLFRATSTDGINWGTSVRCSSNISLSNVMWHPNVWMDESGYHTFCSCFSLNADNAHARLYYGKSADGIYWVMDEVPCVYPNDAGYLSREVYRSCAIPQGDKLKVFVSGASQDNQWHIGTVDMKLVAPEPVIVSEYEPQYIVLAVTSDNISLAANAYIDFAIQTFRGRKMSLMVRMTGTVAFSSTIDYLANKTSATVFTDTLIATGAAKVWAKSGPIDVLGKYGRIRIKNDDATNPITIHSAVLTVWP